ncbi:MAG: aquaporin [Chloroflexi bacterium]|nr:aquaporin [Chloroflexota bacterium]
MDRRTLAPLVAEVLGTFLFFFVGAGAAAAGGDLLAVALAHGLVLAVLVSSLGAVSGAHFNPAVTVGVFVFGRIDAVKAASYIVAQLIGAVLAGLTLVALFPGSSIGTPALGEGISPATGTAIEAILTAVLLFAVLGTAIDARAPRIGGLAIGLAVGADILMGGTLTGAAMNPARWFGPALASGDLSNAYVWIVGPLAGAIAIAAIYRYLLLPEAEPERVPADPSAG